MIVLKHISLGLEVSRVVILVVVVLFSSVVEFLEPEVSEQIQPRQIPKVAEKVLVEVVITEREE